MTSKKWLAAFLATIVLLAAAVAGFNVFTDPFGVFGDQVLDWWSYDMTNNPRTAKIGYLQERGQEYDSYVIGCSSTSSFPTRQLDDYFDASFYNMIMYGADMLDVEQTCRWLLDNCTVKNLVLNVYIDNGSVYDAEEDGMTMNLHQQVDGSSPLSFYGRYLFANVRYGAAKLKNLTKDTWLSQPFDVFDAATGAYDKLARDAEPIGSMEDYLADYPVFADYPHWDHTMDKTRACMDSVAAIRDMCAQAGVNFVVVTAPVYIEYFNDFDRAEVEEFYTALAEVTPFWDFSVSSVSYEPRYFYDETHFRNDVGRMALARMFGDDSVYVPEDFGVYVTEDNVSQRLETYWAGSPLTAEDYTAQVPILMYHHLEETGDDSMKISVSLFEEQIRALAEAGYTAVSFDQLRAYVMEGTPLPEKPVCITFDDGYLSNYELAFPILQTYQMKATIFPIGVSVGKEQYKDTDYDMTPHFSWEQAREMVASGLISIQSHTWDMHQWPPFEQSDTPRENILRQEGEGEQAYLDALARDCRQTAEAFESELGYTPTVLAYPGGQYDLLSQAALNQNGYTVTLSTRHGVNTLVQGLPQSLYGLKRLTMNDGVSVQTMLDWVSGKFE